MPCADYEYQAVYDQAITHVLGTQSTEDMIEAMRKTGRMQYVVKTTVSGPMVESEIYPTWPRRADAPRAPKEKISREAQKALNNKRAARRFSRLLHCNFGRGDILLTLTYGPGQLKGIEQARRDVQNYLRRVKRWRQAHGLPEVKYLAVIEYEDAERPSHRIRLHHHVIMTGMPRAVAEELWGKGRANARRLQPDDSGLEAIAAYLMKDPKGRKRWTASRNLKKPTVSYNHTRLSRRRVEGMLVGREDVVEVIERMYPGGSIDCYEAYSSDIVAGVYIYARLQRRTT